MEPSLAVVGLCRYGPGRISGFRAVGSNISDEKRRRGTLHRQPVGLTVCRVVNGVVTYTLWVISVRVTAIQNGYSV